MTNQQVYDGALRLIGEEPGAAGLSDYAARAPYLLFDACRALAQADRLCREALGYAAQTLPAGCEYPLNGIFPLCDELVAAVAGRIASALLFDENPALSDKLFLRAKEAAEQVLGSLPADIERIVERN